MFSHPNRARLPDPPCPYAPFPQSKESRNRSDRPPSIYRTSADASYEFCLKVLVVSTTFGLIPGLALPRASLREENDAHGADGQHLKSVPDAEQDYEVEPPWAATLDERGAPEGDGQVGAGKKHGWHPVRQAEVRHPF